MCVFPNCPGFFKKELGHCKKGPYQKKKKSGHFKRKIDTFSLITCPILKFNLNLSISLTINLVLRNV